MSLYTVLGGGLSGLVFSTLVKNAKAYEKGVPRNPFSTNFGPMWMHATEATKTLMAHLELPYVVREKSIGILWEGEVHKPSDLKDASQIIQEQYCMKTRKCYPEDLAEKESVMNFGKETSQVLIFDQFDFWDKITKNVVVDMPAIEVNKEAVIFKEHIVLTDKTISTIPLPILLNMTNNPTLRREAQFLKTTQIVGMGYKTETNKFEKYSYVYIPEEKYPFHRLCNGVAEISCEGMGSVNQGHTMNMLNELGLKEHGEWMIRPLGHFMKHSADLKTVFDILEEMEIECLGRYAEWNHKIKFNNVVERALEVM